MYGINFGTPMETTARDRIFAYCNSHVTALFASSTPQAIISRGRYFYTVSTTASYNATSCGTDCGRSRAYFSNYSCHTADSTNN